MTLDLVVEPKYVKPLDVSDLDENTCNESNEYTSTKLEPTYHSYYNWQGYFCNSGSNDDEEFYNGDDDWDGYFQLIEVGRDGGNFGGSDGACDGGTDEECYNGRDKAGRDGARDACDRNHDSEGPTAHTNAFDNQNDTKVEVLGCNRPRKEPH